MEKRTFFGPAVIACFVAAASLVTAQNVNYLRRGISETAPVSYPMTSSGLNLNRSTISGGDSVKGSIELSTTASTDLIFDLDANPANAQLPDRVTVRKGERGAVFLIQTQPVEQTVLVEITARVTKGLVSPLLSIGMSAKLKIVPGILKSLTLNRNTVVSGSIDSKVTGTITLERQAPTGGIDVPLSMSGIATIPPDVNPQSSFVAVMPSTVKVLSGSDSATFIIDCIIPVTAAQQGTLTVTLGGVTKSVGLSVLPLRVASLVILPPGSIGPFQAIGTVTLNAPAGPTTTVQVTSSDFNLVRFGTVGNTQSNIGLVFQGNESVKTFQILAGSVTQLTTVHITASLNGSTFSQAVTVRAP